MMAADTFERALRAADRYQDRGYLPKSWLLTIARNRLIDYRRSTYRHPPAASLDDVEEEAGEDAGCDPRLDLLAQRQQLMQAFERLTPGQRQVIYARFWLELPHAEIGVSTAIRQRLHRALAVLRRALEET